MMYNNGFNPFNDLYIFAIIMFWVKNSIITKVVFCFVFEKFVLFIGKKLRVWHVEQHDSKIYFECEQYNLIKSFDKNY